MPPKLQRLDTAAEPQNTFQSKQQLTHSNEPVTLGSTNALILLLFTSDGGLIRSAAIPADLTQHSVPGFLRIFLASVSISEAWSSPIDGQEECSRRKTSAGQPASDADYLGDPVSLHLDEATVLVAAPTDPLHNTWIGLVLNPLVLHDPSVADAILCSYVDVAKHLVLGSESCDLKIFALWESMWKSLTAGFWWNRDTVTVHVKRALVALGQRRTEKPLRPEHAQGMEPVPEWFQYYVSTFWESVENVSASIEGRFCIISPSNKVMFAGQIVENVSASIEGRFCTLSSSNKVAFADQMTTEQASSILWYYNYFVDGRRSIPWEQLEGQALRLWYRWKSWVLCAQVLTEEAASNRRYSTTRESAVLLLQAFAELADNIHS